MQSRSPASLVLVALALDGCATVSTPEKGVIVTADQTEIVMPVGTHIRTRILKGQTPMTSSPIDTISGERLNNSLLTRDGSIPSVPIH